MGLQFVDILLRLRVLEFAELEFSAQLIYLRDKGGGGGEEGEGKGLGRGQGQDVRSFQIHIVYRAFNNVATYESFTRCKHDAEFQ